MHRTVVSALLGIFILAAAPSVANASFGKAKRLPGDHGSTAQAVNDRGDRALVLGPGIEDRSAAVALASRGGQYRRPVEIPGSRGGDDFRVAIGPTGDVLVVWKVFQELFYDDEEIRDEGCCYNLRAVVIRPGRRIPSARTLWPRGTAFPSIPMPAIRDWKHYGVVARGYKLRRSKAPHERDHGLYAVYSDSRGRWGKGEIHDRKKSAAPIALTATRAEMRVVFERVVDYAQRRKVLELTRSWRGRVSNPRDLELPGEYGVHAIDSDPRGNLVAVWSDYYYAQGALRLGTARRGGTFTTQAPTATDLVSTDQLLVDVASDGSAIVGHFRPAGTTGGELRLAERPAGGAFADFRRVWGIKYRGRFSGLPPGVSLSVGRGGRWAVGLTDSDWFRGLLGRIGSTRVTSRRLTSSRVGNSVAAGSVAMDARGLATAAYSIYYEPFVARGR